LEEEKQELFVAWWFVVNFPGKTEEPFFKGKATR